MFYCTWFHGVTFWARFSTSLGVWTTFVKITVFVRARCESKSYTTTRILACLVTGPNVFGLQVFYVVFATITFSTKSIKILSICDSYKIWNNIKTTKRLRIWLKVSRLNINAWFKSPQSSIEMQGFINVTIEVVIIIIILIITYMQNFP